MRHYRRTPKPGWSGRNAARLYALAEAGTLLLIVGFAVAVLVLGPKPCPGWGRSCGVMTPRELCYFCTKSKQFDKER